MGGSFPARVHKKLTEDFISESIKTEDPAGLCFATSFPLLIYLATKQIKSRLKTGKVPKEMPHDPNFKVDHYLLQIDSDGTILDPTIQQFNKDVEPIYIGKPIDSEVTNKYKLCDLPINSWFQQTYDSWRKTYDDPTFPLTGAFEKRSMIKSSFGANGKGPFKVSIRVLRKLSPNNNNARIQQLPEPFLASACGWCPIVFLLHLVSK